MKITILIISCISIFGIVVCLECLSSDIENITCSDSDYCIYFSGTLNNGSSIDYQGCNKDFVAENGSTLCTGDRYSLGNANKYTLQCCDTDNCNTGNYTHSSNNNLTCLGTSGNDVLKHVKCASNDSYCIYVAGIDDDGKYEKFQGCSAYWIFHFKEIICTENKFINGEDMTLQCCDTNLCNTGKDGPDSIPNSSPVWWIAAGGIVLLLITTSVLINVTLFIKKTKQKNKVQMQFQNEILQKAEKTFIETQIQKTETQWKMFLDSKNLIIDYDNVLGQGSNATVYKAIQKNTNYFPVLKQKSKNSLNSNFVAAKIPTQFGSNQAEEFIREINSLIFLKSHDNIITFLGWTMLGEIPVLITELADTTLLTYVQGISKNENFVKPCLQFLWHISHALEYISEKGMIHRDIACRNILIKDKTIAKLGDFGLCCFADEKTGTFKDSFSQKFPIKWLSLEALNQCIFSEKSDVWAFGILCFEVFSFGSIPYSKMLNSEMIEFLQNGNRLEKPLNATEYIYELMLNCWRQNPNERPNFKEISKGIRIMLENETLKYGYLSLENVLD